MQTDASEWGLLALAFVAASAACYAVLHFFGTQRESHRIDLAAAAAPGARAPGAAAQLQGGHLPPSQFSTWFAWWMRSFQTKNQDPGSPQRLRLLRAGLRDPAMPARFAAVRMLVTLILPALGALLWVLMWALLSPLTSPAAFPAASPVTELLTWPVLAGATGVLAALGYCIPGIWLDRRSAHRQRALASHFPDALDMIRLCVEAGMGLDAAMARVEKEIRMTCAPLYEELHQTGLEMRAGASRQQALSHFAQRVGIADIDALVSMLIQVERLGTSVADSLRIHSDVLRTKKRQRAEEQAAQVPVKLLFPMIFCIFPALMIVLLGPAMISVYRTLTASFAAG